MESPFPSSSSVNSSLELTASVSGNVHSRLTASNSQRRMRSHNRTSSFSELQDIAEKYELSDDSASTSPILPLHRDSRMLNRNMTRSLRWAAALYCIFSAVLFSLYFFNGLLDSVVAGFSWKDKTSEPPTAKLSTAHLLSKSSHLRHTAIAFFPNFLTVNSSSSQREDVSLCLWTVLEELHEVLDVVKHWKGPISLLVVTTVSPASPAFHRLRIELDEFQNSSPVGGRLNTHILQKVPNANHSPNSYMNLARLLAPTRHVIMYPGKLTKPVSTKLFDAVTSRASSTSWLDPIVLTSGTIPQNSTIPFADLAALFIQRDHPLWCTERFFTATSRAADWQECLWQFWLSSSGHLQSMTDARWNAMVWDREVEDRQSTLARIHRRLTARSRHETCIMAGKRLKDKSVRQGRIDKKKARWLKETCKQVLSNWERGLI